MGGIVARIPGGGNNGHKFTMPNHPPGPIPNHCSAAQAQDPTYCSNTAPPPKSQTGGPTPVSLNSTTSTTPVESTQEPTSSTTTLFSTATPSSNATSAHTSIGTSAHDSLTTIAPPSQNSTLSSLQTTNPTSIQPSQSTPGVSTSLSETNSENTMAIQATTETISHLASASSPTTTQQGVRTHPSHNAGAIAGSVIGGIALLIIVLLFMCKRTIIRHLSRFRDRRIAPSSEFLDPASRLHSDKPERVQPPGSPSPSTLFSHRRGPSTTLSLGGVLKRYDEVPAYDEHPPPFTPGSFNDPVMEKVSSAALQREIWLPPNVASDGASTAYSEPGPESSDGPSIILSDHENPPHLEKVGYITRNESALPSLYLSHRRGASTLSMSSLIKQYGDDYPDVELHPSAPGPFADPVALHARIGPDECQSAHSLGEMFSSSTTSA